MSTRREKQFDCFITDRVTCSSGSGWDDITSRQLMNIEWKKITSESGEGGGKFAKYFPHIFTPFHAAKIGIKLNSTLSGKRLKCSFRAEHI